MIGELSCEVNITQQMLDACRGFDYTPPGTSVFTLPEFAAPRRDGTWGIGCIVGPSGSGKTSLLRQHYGITRNPQWDTGEAIISHFHSADDAVKRFAAVGLNSVPSWCRPYSVLSNGEQFRANLARLIGDNVSIDEFTSVVDRDVAKSCSRAISRYVRREGLTGLVLTTCHRDVVPWVDPDWVFDAGVCEFLPRGRLRREPLCIAVEPAHRGVWQTFRNHHYMSGDISDSARCWCALLDGQPIGFAAAIAMPCGSVKNAWREHRVVILPDFQGLGLGTRLSDTVAQMFIEDGHRYFSRTAHPRMGQYREKSPLWRATSKNLKKRTDVESRLGRGVHYNNYIADWRRVCYSHEYIGASPHGD